MGEGEGEDGGLVRSRGRASFSAMLLLLAGSWSRG